MVYMFAEFDRYHSKVISYSLPVLKHFQIYRQKTKHFKKWLSYVNFFLSFCMLNNLREYGSLLIGHTIGLLKQCMYIFCLYCTA